MPGDEIIRQNEEGFQMYFINNGSVDIQIKQLTIDK